MILNCPDLNYLSSYPRFARIQQYQHNEFMPRMGPRSQISLHRRCFDVALASPHVPPMCITYTPTRLVRPVDCCRKFLVFVRGLCSCDNAKWRTNVPFTSFYVPRTVVSTSVRQEAKTLPVSPPPSAPESLTYPHPAIFHLPPSAAAHCHAHNRRQL